MPGLGPRGGIGGGGDLFFMLFNISSPLFWISIRYLYKQTKSTFKQVDVIPRDWIGLCSTYINLSFFFFFFSYP